MTIGVNCDIFGTTLFDYEIFGATVDIHSGSSMYADTIVLLSQVRD